MTYTPKTWSTEKILDPDLNNIEDGLDQVHNLATTLDGVKTLLENPKVERVDAGIDLHDTDGGGVYYIIRSVDGKVEIYDFDAAAVKIANIIAHSHGGGTSGAQIPHANLTSVLADQHHTQVHARVSSDHTGLEDPLNVDDVSPSVAEFQTMEDPYPGDSESLPAEIRGELRRLRYQFDQIIGLTNWYQDPAVTLQALASHASRHHSGGADALSVPSIAGEANYLLVDGTRDMQGPLTFDTDNAYDLGESGFRIRDIFFIRNLIHGTTTLINSSRNLVGLNKVAQTLLPSTTNAYDLGGSTSRFKDGYFQGDIAVAGLVDGVDVAAHQSRHAVGGADPLSVGVPAATGVSNAEGSAADFARRDHVHATTALRWVSSTSIGALDTEKSITIPSSKTVVAIFQVTHTAGTPTGNFYLRLNNASTTVYAWKHMLDNIAPVTGTNDTEIQLAPVDHFTSGASGNGVYLVIWIYECLGGTWKRVSWRGIIPGWGITKDDDTVIPMIVSGAGIYDVVSGRVTSIQLGVPNGNMQGGQIEVFAY